MFWKIVARWALVAIAVPLAAKLIRRISQRIEVRKGSTTLSRTLTRTATAMDVVTQRRRGSGASATPTLSCLVCGAA